MDLNFEYGDYPYDGTQLCNDSNSHIFFPDEYTEPSVLQAAKEICSSCPLINQCLEYAIRTPWLDGIWGGTTPRQRSRMRGMRNRTRVRA